MIKRFYSVKSVAVALVLSAAYLTAMAQPVKVVYHMNEGIPQASRAMANIRNHLVAEPNVQIVVVAHGLGIDFLLDGAVNQMDQPFAGAVSELTAKGVEFRVCQNTLNNRKIPESRVLMEAKVVPSGVAETARIQAREGFVYMRP